MRRVGPRYGWLRPLWQRLFGTPGPRAGHGGPRRATFRPACEGLEDRLAPSVTLSVSNPLPFPEGDSGTSNMLFVVTRAGDPAAAVRVDYATQDGTGANPAHAGTDYVATSGTLTFAANQTSATIAVPVIGNTIFQTNRSFTVTLANPLASASFAAQQTFVTGRTPGFVTWGDVNGDGKPDLITANGMDNTVSVLLSTTLPGATTPSFATRQTFAVASDAVSVTVGDVNGDGKPDLIVTHGVGIWVSVLLNTTAPGATVASFAPEQTFIAGGAPVSVALGDVNGDGKPDLIVANFIGDSVSVLLNTTLPGATTPSFATQQSFATGSWPTSVAVADVNGDGKPDLITTNYGTDTVSVLLNTTAPGATVPSFAPQQTFFAGYGPDSVAVGDVNGDGKPDLIVADHDGNSVSVLLNTTAPGAATASFADNQTFATGRYPRSVALGDVNGDGKPDLLVANLSDGTVSVLLNTTAPGATIPSFANQQTFAAGHGIDCVALGDVNGDGKPDLLVANLSDGTVSVLLNIEPVTPAFNLAAQQTFATGARPTSVALADVNGDGKPDLIAVNLDDGTVSVLLNTTAPGAAAPSFAAQQTFAVGRNPYALAVADLNGDGRPDLIITNEGLADVSVLLNTTVPGADTVTFAPRQTFATGGLPLAASAADVNGDGKSDLITANFRDNTVSVLLNTTAPGATTASFAAQQTFATGSAPISVAAGDVNGDGKPDLVVADFHGDTASVLLNMTTPGSGTAAFAPRGAFATGRRPIAVALADVNGDGKPDLVAANFYDGTVSVLLNAMAPGAATPSFAAQQTFAAGRAPHSVAVGDVNGDGRPDLITVNNFDNTASVLLNATAPGAGTAAFAAPQAFATGRSPYAVALGDVNGDGRPDLVVANQGSATLSVFLNASSTVTLGSAAATGTILDDDAPVSVTAVSGTTPQSASLYEAFTHDMAVRVCNAAGHPVQGVSVRFASPAAGGTFGGSATVTTDAGGLATAPTFTAGATPGSYRVTASASGGGNPFAAFDLTNTTPISVTPPGLPNGKVGAGYGQVIAATGGTAPYTYRVSAGALPAGLALDPRGGLLGGVPRVPGTFQFVVTVADSSTGPGPYIAIQGFTLTVAQGNPARLVFLTQPGAVLLGGWLAPFQVLALDQFGNRLSSVVVNLTLKPIMTMGSVSFRAGSVVQAVAVNGVATFSHVAISARGRYQLCACDFPGVLALSDPFNVSPTGRQI